MASAQDRLPSIPKEKMTVDQEKAVAEFKVARQAELSGPFIPMLRSPEVMTRARQMGDYLRFKSVLPPRLSEFLILITSREWTQQFEWNTHYRIALDAGLTPHEAVTQEEVFRIFGESIPRLRTTVTGIVDRLPQTRDWVPSHSFLFLLTLGLRTNQCFVWRTVCLRNGSMSMPLPRGERAFRPLWCSVGRLLAVGLNYFEHLERPRNVLNVGQCLFRSRHVAALHTFVRRR